MSSSACSYLPAAGNRNYNDGTLNNVGSNGNYWSSTVNGTNSYNLNFNSSNVNPANNNNRANGFSVRCVSELNVSLFILINIRKMDKDILLFDLFRAYYDARKHKRNTVNQIRFEIDYEKNLIALCEDILAGSYSVSHSICFVIDKPVKREIFAADFRDRIIHHLVYNYINPVFDGMFIEDSYSCRKNKGTLYGIRRVQGFIRECSRDYTVDCYILKLDIKGYFMSINKDILYGLLSSSIEEAAKDEDRKSLLGADTGLIMYLIQNTLYDDPVENCVVRGQRSDWQGLPPSKSLFHSRCGCGLPIGNLTSQLFSNVYLHPLDTYVKSVLQMPYYGRYVDDFVLVHNDRNVLKQAVGKIEAFLDGELQLELHPLKRYLQHYTKGVNFLGAVIKPHRSYIANRTKKNFTAGVRFWNNRLSSGEPTSAELAEMRACINSYLGIMMHHYSYNIRKKALLDKENLFLKYGYLNAGLRRFVLKKKYRPPDRGIFASRRVNRFKPETIEICCTEKTLSIL